jgi:hypothetical protein
VFVVRDGLGSTGPRGHNSGAPTRAQVDDRAELRQDLADRPNDASGHYAAHEAPAVLVDDIRRFFQGLT